jgi:hypothetical protein
MMSMQKPFQKATQCSVLKFQVPPTDAQHLVGLACRKYITNRTVGCNFLLRYDVDSETMDGAFSLEWSILYSLDLQTHDS